MGDTSKSIINQTNSVSMENQNSAQLSLPSPGRKRGQSDLRSAAILCHNQISKDLWGKKKHANSFVDHLRPSEVEAFALDISLRAYWELQKAQDSNAQCSLSVQGTSQLRQLTMDILRKHQLELTKEYSFEIFDPVVVRQREEEKQQQIEASREQRKQRAEAAKKERAERAARVRANRLAKQQAEKEKKSIDAEVTPTTDIKANQPFKKPEKIVQNSKNIISAPVDNSSSQRIKTSEIKTRSMPSGFSADKKTFKMPAGFSSEKKSFKIQPPPKRTASEEKQDSIAAFAARTRSSEPDKKSKSFKVPPRIIKPPDTLSSTSVNDKLKKGGSNRAAAAMKAFQATKKKEKTFTPPSKTPPSELDSEPIPTITLKQTLVNTEQLVPLLYKSISDNFQNLQSSPNDEDQPLDFYHCTVKGPRPANEDEYAVVEHMNELYGLDKDSDNFSFFGAYDGHCGKYTSLFIRSQIHHKVCKHSCFPHEMETAINESILHIDSLVNDVQERDDFACGSTVLAVWVRNNEELIVGNVGDCRGFICRGGKPIELADPHHPTRPDEKERIESLGGAVVKRGAWRVNGILAVSRSIGDCNLKKFVIADPEVTRFDIQPEDDFVIIASDGLWDVVKPEEMIDIVQETCKTKGRNSVCQTLCDTALEKQSKDNVTVVALFFNK